MKKLFFFAIIIFISPILGGGRVAAQTTNEPGSGNCLTYNGNGNYVSVGSNYSSFLQVNFSIEGWILVPSGDDGVFLNVPYISMSSSSIDFAVVTGKLRVRLIFNAAGTDFTMPISTSTIADNKWHHVATTYDGITHNIYVDGILEGSVSHSGNVRTGSITQTFFGAVGAPYTTLTNALQCQLDEFRIWNRALTQAEIQQNMCQKLTVCADPNLVGYWRFDEGIDNTCSGGQDVCDASCNGNHGIKF